MVCDIRFYTIVRMGYFGKSLLKTRSQEKKPKKKKEKKKDNGVEESHISCRYTKDRLQKYFLSFSLMFIEIYRKIHHLFVCFFVCCCSPVMRP